MVKKDKNKLAKAGFATPRGGAKGAYQNHVNRSNRVIVPFERLDQAPISDYHDGYIIRLYPHQYFESNGQVKAFFKRSTAPKVGRDAFVLYRTYHQLSKFPPPPSWRVRSLTLDGIAVSDRKVGVLDHGEYVLRVAAYGKNKRAKEDGPPQGIFAPEYADKNSNFLSKCILAWLISKSVDSPYVAAQAKHLELILKDSKLFDPKHWEKIGLMHSGHTSCPLCMKYITYSELHGQLSFTGETALLNAGEQVANATRSTEANLFHMVPLAYSQVEHMPQNVAWGHAICNTKLGQRKCYPLSALIDDGQKVGVVEDDGIISTFGWISNDLEMIRSPSGAVWIRIVEDHLSPEEQGKLIDILSSGRVK